MWDMLLLILLILSLLPNFMLSLIRKDGIGLIVKKYVS